MKIQAKSNIQWRHVSTDENPADIGTRACGASKLSELWWLGPKWLAEREQWPDDIETIPTSETETEAKLVKDVLAIAVKFDDNLDHLMVNHTFWKAVQILSWVARFLHNCRHKTKQCLSGPLKTEEIDEQIGVWVKRAQAAYLKTEQFSRKTAEDFMSAVGESKVIIRFTYRQTRSFLRKWWWLLIDELFTGELDLQWLQSEADIGYQG